MTTNFSSIVTPPRDQRRYWQNSCGGYAIANAMSIVHYLTFKKRRDFNPFYSWNAAKWLCNPRVTGDSSVFGDELSKGVEMFGALPNMFSALPNEYMRDEWLQKADCVPSVWEAFAAARYKCTRFRCSTRTDDLVHGEDILKQVRIFLKVTPVIFAVKMNAAFMTLGSGIWYPDENNLSGIGHFVCAVADDPDGSCIHIVNSFGDTWGQNGFGKVSYRAFEVLAASDAWAFGNME